MNAATLAQASGLPSASGTTITDGFQMRGAWQLVKLVFLGLPLFRFFTVLGLLLIPVALIGYQYSRILAFGISIYLCITILGIPYAGAVPQLRRLLSNQRLTLLPGIAFTSVLLALLLATLLAISLPFAMWVCDIPQPVGAIGLRIFTIATIYAAFTWFGMTNRTAAYSFGILPLLFLGTLQVLNSNFPGWWQQPAVVFGSFGASILAWLWALLALRGRQRFATLSLSMSQSGSAGTDYQQQLSYQPWLYRVRSVPSAATVLLGYPGDWRGRLESVGFSLILMPAIFASLAWFLGRDDRHSGEWLEMFVFMHLAITAFTPFAWGELTARSRCLWLRHGGTRASLWQFLEGQLRLSFLFMTACSSIMVMLVTTVGERVDSRIFLLALLLTLSSMLHNACYSVMVRLRHWAAWMQIVYMIVLTTALAFGVYWLHAYVPAAWSLLVSPILVVLALVYRSLAKGSFVQVDWLRLKPLVVSRNTAAG